MRFEAARFRTARLVKVVNCRLTQEAGGPAGVDLRVRARPGIPG
ncbi:hypothetical protein SAMN05192575_101929 [Nocardioides alpinus]|uniref:Uncharacterized protein n=1 Tax=Nocardioides alpinus TaxID=748909 RepID=A0A1I0WDN6_9ACTN|nr:hypothetical protein SAMN05192575_101929 [Nocardioides alpinus]